MANIVISSAVLAKAGKGLNTSISSGVLKTANGDYLTQWISQAESYVCAVSKYNWIDAYAGLDADLKYVVEEAISNLAAIYAIQWDMSGYTSRVEAEDMINVLWARFNQCIDILGEDVRVKFLKGA